MSLSVKDSIRRFLRPSRGPSKAQNHLTLVNFWKQQEGSGEVSLLIPYPSSGTINILGDRVASDHPSARE
jgi:hypothetical protein